MKGTDMTHKCVGNGIVASPTKLQVYGACPYRAKLAYLDRIPEPPTPEGEVSPLDRGSEIHKWCEDYVIGKRDDIPLETLSDAHFNQLTEYRDFYAAGGAVAVEQLWGFDEAWAVCDPFDKDVAIRVKLDLVIVDDDEGEALVVDYKSGKKYRNEIKHQDAMQFYGVATKMRFPFVDDVTTRLSYLDVDEETQTSYTGRALIALQVGLQRRIMALRTDRMFLAKPSITHCGYCPYKTGKLGQTEREGTGDCNLNP